MMGESKIKSLGSKVGQSGGFLSGRAVMWDVTKENTVINPTVNTNNFAGIADYTVANSADGVILATTKQISLTPYGDVECIAAAAIAVADYVYISSTDGKLSKIPATAGTWNVIGQAVSAALTNLDRFIVRLFPCPVPVVVGAVPPGWTNGAGAPSNAVGSDGDYYLNTTNGDVYLKSVGVYNVIVNLKGATGTSGYSGANGTSGYSGYSGFSGISGHSA